MADYTDKYNTQLTPEQEAAFLATAPRLNDLFDYDLRGAYLAGAAKAGNGHLPDTFKKPNHPTFSKESQYNADGIEGGEWVDLGNGKFAFRASPYNLTVQSPDQLKKYFQEREPDVQLILPEGRDSFIMDMVPR